MVGEWTPAVERALEKAETLALEQGCLTVDGRHLLLGFLEEEEGLAWTLLTAAGLDPARVRTELAATTAGGEPADRILVHARHLASTFSADQTLASDQVVLAILERDRPLRAHLETLGLDASRVEAAIAHAIGLPLPLDEPLDLRDPAGQSDSLRILDACANRAREALRVLEDYARFALNDTYLTGQLKTLRHELADLLTVLPPGELLASRETQHDVGTRIATEQEMRRESLTDVVAAACKRLQEALRSAEEYGKLHGQELAMGLEALRYRSYTLERALLVNQGARQRLADVRLGVLLTESLGEDSLARLIRQGAAGGVQMFQLRDKTLDDRTRLARGRLVRRLTRETETLFIQNDRPDLARLLEADGVHLGQEDLPVKEARQLLGSDSLIGVSTHSLDQVRQALLDGASYLGVGPTFQSKTKDFRDLAGLDFVRQAMAETSLPAFIIGGVTLDNLPSALDAGARRVAVSAALCHADEPEATAAAFRRLLDSY